MKEGEKAIRILSEKWPEAKDLRKSYPELSDLLKGGFKLGGPDNEYIFNVNEEGRVVSRPLVQGREKDPTIGVILPGVYLFPTKGNRETMIVLEGILSAGINDGPISTLRKYGSIIAPAWNTLKLETSSNVFYLCQYKPKKGPVTGVAGANRDIVKK